MNRKDKVSGRSGWQDPVFWALGYGSFNCEEGGLGYLGTYFENSLLNVLFYPLRAS